MRAKRFPILAACTLSLLASLASSGCSSNPVSATARTQGAALRELQASTITDTGSLSVHSMLVIRTLDLEEQWAKDQVGVFQKLRAAQPGAVQEWQLKLAVSELAYHLADQQRDPRKAQELFLTALLTAGSDLSQVVDLGSVFDPRHRLMAEIYNRGLARFIALGQTLDGHLKDWKEVSDGTSTYRLQFGKGPGFLDPAYFDQLIPAQEFRQEGLANEHKRFGIGATLVGFHDNTIPGGRKVPQYPPWIHRPVTVLMRLPQDGALRLLLLNPFTNETFKTRKGEDITLSADFTAPLAYAVANSPLFTQENPSLFHPEEFAPMTGLYLSQPYDPDKISVVLVHGLWSSPLTWIWLVNEIWGDPELRARYQVWYYAYPTGLPILANSSTFRNNLLALRKQLDPDGNDIATQNMLLIGHSMGGLLSKMMAKTTGDRLWNKRFTKPFDRIVATDEELALLRSIGFYEALPFIKRIIFMCTPHRGSTMADGFVGAFGSWLISLPEGMEQKFAAFLAKNPGIVRPHDGEVDLELQDSIKGLSAESPVLNEMDAIPFRAGLPYHSIIGDEEEAGRTGGSDGVVEYWSSHLDGALSEKVVKSPHSATGHQAAMAEVRRILKLHLKGQKQP